MRTTNWENKVTSSYKSTSTLCQLDEQTGLFVKTSLRLKPFIWKGGSFPCKSKLFSRERFLSEDSFWNRGIRNLGNDCLTWISNIWTVLRAWRLAPNPPASITWLFHAHAVWEWRGTAASPLRSTLRLGNVGNINFSRSSFNPCQSSPYLTIYVSFSI